MGDGNDSTEPDTTDLAHGPSATIVCSNDRTNYLRTQNHGLYIDEPADLSHSFKKGGRGEAPSAFGYLLVAALGCQVNSLEQMLHKARVTDNYEIQGECTGYTLTEDNAKRIERLELEITLFVPDDVQSPAQRCLDVYETGCVVGESLKRGIDLDIDKELVTTTPDDTETL